MDSEEEPHELKKKKPLFNLTLLSHDFHEQYHSALNTSHFLESLAHTFPNHTTLVHVGHSYEGRKIMGIKISNPNRVKKGAKERKSFVIMGAQHAREWVATSTALYIAHALLVDPVEQSTADAKHSIRRLLEHFDFHIIPLPNPDGYHYTRKHNRLWYKNRQPVSTGHGKGVCKGMDMNRNWVNILLGMHLWCSDSEYFRDMNGAQHRTPVQTLVDIGTQALVPLKHMRSTRWLLTLLIEPVDRARLQHS